MALERRPIPLQIGYLLLAFSGFVIACSLLARWLP